MRQRLPQILDFVDANGLNFQGWLDSGIYNRDRWCAIEALSGRIATHGFIATTGVLKIVNEASYLHAA